MGDQNRKFTNLFIIGLILLLILLTLSYFAFIDCSSPLGRSNCTRVLFIGNSFTYVNDLPGMFSGLARAGGHKVATGMVAPGGWTLAQHAASQDTINAITGSPWNYVILQEQSLIPADNQIRSQNMTPAVQSLDKIIRDSQATPMLYMTWARKEGWPEMRMNDYESMQSRIIEGYLSTSRQFKIPVAPVGYAWLLERRQNPQLEHWDTDGIHPNPNGTYLAACVFYATLFNKSPVGLLYYGGLPTSTARELQLQAEKAVEASKQWGIY